MNPTTVVITNKDILIALENGWKVLEIEGLKTLIIDDMDTSKDYHLVVNDIRVPTLAIRPDGRIFGFVIEDERMSIAFSRGWTILKTFWNNVYHYDLVPPRHFTCFVEKWYSKSILLNFNRWISSESKEVKNNVVSINIPEWYFDDNVLLYGVRKG